MAWVACYTHRMASRAETIEYIYDQLGAPPYIRYIKMFGQYALYLDEKVVAFICDDELFVTPTEQGRAFIGVPEEAPAYPGSKMYFFISGERWEDREWLSELLHVTADALPVPRPKKRKRATPPAGRSAPDGTATR